MEDGLVEGCLNTTAPGDRLFDRGWRRGAHHLSRSERALIASVTGHVAESVVELLLNELGWEPLWHFSGPGYHGVDLVFLAPGDRVVVVEVKGTLLPGKVPRLGHREILQMSSTWIDKCDNPGMTDLNLTSADVYGGVIAVNFPDRTWRTALTRDFDRFIPVTGCNQLRDTSWLTKQ